MNGNTDLNRFKNLYDSVGVKYVEEYAYGIYQFGNYLQDMIILSLCVNEIPNNKIVGYNGYTTELMFDQDGNFLYQAVWGD